jgi:hypothetical protein
MILFQLKIKILTSKLHQLVVHTIKILAIFTVVVLVQLKAFVEKDSIVAVFAAKY